jgi:hypothetical protein
MYEIGKNGNVKKTQKKNIKNRKKDIMEKFLRQLSAHYPPTGGECDQAFVRPSSETVGIFIFVTFSRRLFS